MICDIRLVVFLECKLDLSRVDEVVDELGRKKKAVTHSAVVYLQRSLYSSLIVSTQVDEVVSTLRFLSTAF